MGKKSDFQPNKHNLDGEWVKQPDLYHEYATQLADARMELERAKNQLDITTAELDNDIRSNPDAYKLAKITDAVVKATIPNQPEHKKAFKAWLRARHEHDVIEAAVKSLDHKKKALENLVYLHGQNYYSEPHAKGEDNRGMEEVVRRKKRDKQNPNLTRRQLREEEDDE